MGQRSPLRIFGQIPKSMVAIVNKKVVSHKSIVYAVTNWTN